MPHTATYPSDALLGRYAEGRVSVSIAATPPPVNQSFTTSYVRFLLQEKVRCVVGAGHLTWRALCREDTTLYTLNKQQTNY